MVEGVYSFDRMREACLADQPQAWSHFVKNYTPVAGQLLAHYFPKLELRALLKEVFRQARAHQAQLWRSFAGLSEKEFLLHFRGFLFAQGRAARGAAPETPLTPETFWALLEGFPPLQREMLALSFRGYSPEQLSTILKFQPETTHAALARAREKLQAQLGPVAGPEPDRRDHDALFAALEQRRGEGCLPDRTFVHIVDGQIAWRDREEADRHLENCLYCVNRFAEFREVFHFFRSRPPAEDAAVADLLAALGLPAQAPVRTGGTWWQRLLGG